MSQAIVDERARARRMSLKETTAPITVPEIEPPGDGDETPDQLVPDAVIRKEFGLSKMGAWRWDQDVELAFPPPVSIRGKNYRSRKAIEAFKRLMIARAIAAARDKRARRAQAAKAA